MNSIRPIEDYVQRSRMSGVSPPHAGNAIEKGDES